MKKIFYALLVSCIGFTIFISCSKNSGDDITENTTTTEDISFDPSSVPDNATTVAFGQSYQYLVGTSGTYSGTFTFSLSNQPDNMTISSSGLVEWTPTKASEIKTHSDITITLTTASGYVLTLTYDLTVTGTCVSGNVLAIWSGDQRTSTDSSNLLGNVTAYTDNSSNGGNVCGEDNDEDCTAANNYDYRSASVHLTHGPTPTATTGNVFFYNQYDNTTHLYFFYMFGVEDNSNENTVKIDVFTSNNTSASSDIVDDGEGGGETHRTSQSLTDGLYSSSYKSRNSYDSANSDGAVIGPFTGAEFRIFVDLGGTSTIDSQTLTLGNLESFKYYSKDGTSFPLKNSSGGAVDNFTVGYNTTLDCNNL